MMSDVEKYIKKRKKFDPEFAEGFESGYASFKIGVLLAQAREEAGITKKELARKLNKHQSLISRIENHAENVGISTLEKYANALGKKITIEIS
ncbi:helix-turn-helix domain-containing protein [Aerosakkonemataceae cyanobacterium BLCC-F50]|uniref:Helix-turn-helix domain-containing protein n=1 Tax=Floridaenema flaviceps BLCC-F50 TaxID=3153642 RepID=A0ABV4XVD9_9CYAN